MIIKAVKLYENGFMTQPFALGGEDGVEKFDPAVKYRSSLQNFVIDTGKEVILMSAPWKRPATSLIRSPRYSSLTSMLTTPASSGTSQMPRFMRHGRSAPQTSLRAILT